MYFYRHVMSVKCNFKWFNKTKAVDNRRVNLNYKKLLENFKLIIKASLSPREAEVVNYREGER